MDPSTVGFGAVKLEYKENESLTYIGSYGFKSSVTSKGTDNKIRIKHELQAFLSELVKDADVVCTEYPHGTKNSYAAWSLYTCNAMIFSTCSVLGIDYFTFTQNQSKKNLLNSQLDDEVTMDYIITRRYQQFGYRRDKVKKWRTAYTDAMSIFDLYMSINHTKFYKEHIKSK